MMNRKYAVCFHFVMLAIVGLLVRPAAVSALPPQRQQITSPSQLIDAVNGLRLAYGLPTLAVHSILMQTAQTQADYMASTGQITHSRPGGMTYTQQLIMLGFPLAGDLSLGGFRAENILMQTNPLIWDGVPSAWQDPDHMNTMLSQNFSHIGAGISRGGDGYYYAVDCAATTGSGQMQGDAASILTSVPGGGEAGSSGISQFMVPVVKSTAHPDGDVYHTVQYGQTLWSIAIEYGTTIKSIQTLNNLGEDLVIYQGQELLVLIMATQPAPATQTPGPVPTQTSPAEVFTATAMLTGTSPAVAMTGQDDTQVSLEEVDQNSSRALVVVLIIAAFIGAGMAVWLIRDPKS